MSLEFAFKSAAPLKVYSLVKKRELTKLDRWELKQLAKGYQNDERKEYIYYVRKDRKKKASWFINNQEFHLMKLIAKLENDIKQTDERLVNSKSNLNKVNLSEVYALQTSQIFWIKSGSQSQALIENFLGEKLKKDRDLEKKFSSLIEANVNALATLKDLMQSRLQPNFEETIIRIEEIHNR